MYFDAPVAECVDAGFATLSLRYGLMTVAALVLVLGILPNGLLTLFAQVMTY
jgi:hypothetical protein